MNHQTIENRVAALFSAGYLTTADRTDSEGAKRPLANLCEIGTARSDAKTQQKVISAIPGHLKEFLPDAAEIRCADGSLPTLAQLTELGEKRKSLAEARAEIGTLTGEIQAAKCAPPRTSSAGHTSSASNLRIHYFGAKIEGDPDAIRAEFLRLSGPERHAFYQKHKATLRAIAYAEIENQ